MFRRFLHLDGSADEGDKIVVKAVKPTVLIGTSTNSRAFNEEIVKEMAKHVERPIIVSLFESVSDVKLSLRNNSSPCLILHHFAKLIHQTPWNGQEEEH